MSRIAREQLYELTHSALFFDHCRSPGAQLVIVIQLIKRIEVEKMLDIDRCVGDRAPLQSSRFVYKWRGAENL